MTTDLVALPASANPKTWDGDGTALMEFSGLTWVEKRGEESVRLYAPAGVVAGFLAACRRTGLDPTAKQIYAAIIGGKWTILTGVDGMRVVAQRSGEYQGQTPVEWTADGVTWVQAWLSKEPPAAARVGVLRRGFQQPLYQVVTWAEFGKTTGQWAKIPAHMLGIRAETHALRRAFPNDLSGLYTVDDFDDDTTDTSDAIILPTEDWATLIADAVTKDNVIALMRRCQALGEITDDLRTQALTKIGVFSRAEAEAAASPAAVDIDVVEEPTETDWEAREAARFAAGDPA